MKKDDQIAAAIALRGMAKDGKFAVKELTSPVVAESPKKPMKKDDQIAAAMVLRGMAKDGQFALKPVVAESPKKP
nr:VOVO protein [synthetic construct]